MKTVVYIGPERVGIHGGVHQMLTLECGHLAIHHVRKFRMRDVFAPMKRFAVPKKKRCAICEQRP